MDGPYREHIFHCKTALLVARETFDALRTPGALDTAEKLARVQARLPMLTDNVLPLAGLADQHARSELELGLSQTYPMLSKELLRESEGFKEKAKDLLSHTSNGAVNVAQRYELEKRLNGVKDVLMRTLVAIQIWAQWSTAQEQTVYELEAEPSDESSGEHFNQQMAALIKGLLDETRTIRDYSKAESADSTIFMGKVRVLQRTTTAVLEAVHEAKHLEDEAAIKAGASTFTSQARLRYRGKCADEDVDEAYKQFKEALLTFLRNARAGKSVLEMMRSMATLSLDGSSEPAPEEDPEEKRLRMLGRSQAEMLDTESKYYIQLNVLKTQFVDILKKDASLGGLKQLAEPNFQSLLSNVISLEGLTHVFVDGLKDEMRPGRKRAIGSLFNRNAPALRMYSGYINVYDAGMEALKEARSSHGKFDSFCREFEKLASLQDVSFSFIQPVQRCPRYEMLLANILKFTPEGDPEHRELVQALAKVREVNTFINVKKRQDENRRKLADIQNAIQWPGKPRVLNESGVFRQFVREGVLESGKKEVYYWFLLSDMMLKTTVIKSTLKLLKKLNTGTVSMAAGAPALHKRYVLVAALPFSKLSLEAGDSELQFRLVEDETGVAHLCESVSEDEAALWKKDISSALLVNKI